MSSSWRGIAAVAGNPAMGRLLTAGALFVLGELTTWIAVLIYAFEQGGAVTAAMLVAAQLTPGVVVGPLVASVTERRSPTAVLTVGYLTQAATMAATAAVSTLDCPPAAVYAGAVAVATAVTMTRPAGMAALPALSGGEADLTAANVLSGWLEDAATVGAGLLAGFTMAQGSPAPAFGLGAVFAVTCALLVGGIRVPPVRTADESAGRACLRTTAQGLSAIRRRPSARVLVGLILAMEVVIGALDLILVVLAVDVLQRGSEWAGYLNAAFGAGGVLAAAITLRLPGRKLGRTVVVSAGVAWFCIAATALSMHAAVTMALLAATGVGLSVLRTSARTLLQRTVPAAQVGTVFGVVEGLSMAALAIGAGLVPVLHSIGGPTAAMLGVAAVLPLAALLGTHALFRLDAAACVPVTEICLLRMLPELRRLPASALEALAAHIRSREVPDGTVIARRGDPAQIVRILVRGRLMVSGGNPLAAQPGSAGRPRLLDELWARSHGVSSITITARGPVTLMEMATAAYRRAVGGVTG